MTIAVLGDDNTKKLLAKKGIAKDIELLWCGSPKILVATVADAYFDFLYENNQERNAQYEMRKDFPFFVNCVERRSSSIPSYLIRINGWNSFFDREWAEVVALNQEQERIVSTVFDALQWKYKQVTDLPGMISARIVASIINEAYYTLGDAISTKEEIDTAMKLGTNYPLGPFEWANKIGLENLYQLLAAMHQEDERLSVAPALIMELGKLRNEH
jgi:3-hydroxybutyryl-CoA dehydrogenase